MSTFARICRSAVLFVSATLPLAAAAQQTRRVPQDFPTIQAAINASATGDTVLVGPGTWFENLTLDTKEITLTSSAGPATTTLDGSHLGPVLQITNTPGIATILSGFTVQNGTPSASSLSPRTAGVLIANAGAHISNATFQKNAGVNIGVLNGSISLESTRISTASTANGACALASGTIFPNPSTGVYLSGTTTISTPALVLGPIPVPSIFRDNTIFGDGTRCSGIGIQAVNVSPRLLLTNNILRNNSIALSASNSAFVLRQSLVYDNAAGALSIATPLISHPSTDPATTLLVNNTIVNNLTSPDPQSTSPADVTLTGTIAQIAFRNNILVGTTPHPILTCETQTPSANDTPLILDHNDIFNTSAGPTLIGDCTPTIASPLSVNGNLSADPRLAGSTDLHPQAGSPAIDAGLTFFDGSTDLDGNPRLADATGLGYPAIDLGAYERPAAATAKTATFLDLAPFAAPLTPTGPTSTVPTVTGPQYVTSPGSITVFTHVGALSSPFFTQVASGSITLLSNGVPVGTASPDSDGFAIFHLSLLTTGVVPLTAQYSPSPGLAPSTSPLAYMLVEDAPTSTTTLTLAATPATQTLNQPITLAIHLGSTTTAGTTTTAGPVPPGDVTVSEGSTLLTTLQPDSSGLATYTIPKPGLGSHTYTVTYAGTTLYPAATAATSVSITAPVATTLTATANPAVAPRNTPVSCTARVVAASGPAPTGTVTFTDGATPAGSVPLTVSQGGLATLALSNLTFGLHTIAVTFNGDPGFSSSTGTCTVNIGGDATAISLLSSRNPAATTDLVTYTATVTNTGTSGATTSPAGSVSLSEGNTLLATAPLLAASSGSSTASLPVTLTTPGLHILTAMYLPATTANFASSATLTETITAPPAITTTLSATPNPVTFNQATVLSASVTSTAAIPYPASITFTDGATVLGTVALPAVGPAILSVSTLSVGTHPIGAILHTAGTTVVRSTASPITLQVNGLPDTLTLTVSPLPSALATAPVTLTATLATAATLPSGTTLGGAVTFLDGNLPLGTASVSADGRATLTTTALTPGPHTLTASFAGNLIFTAATSASVIEQITTNPTTTSLSVTPASATAFASVSLSAHVASTTSTTRINAPVCTPACTPITITFLATSATGPETLGVVPVDASGNATLALHPPAGKYSLAATFSGSPLFAASSSAFNPLTVSAAATALTLTANPNPVYQHGKVTLTAALTAPGIPASALSGTITFLEGSTTLGTAPLATAQAFAYTPATVGAHTLTAVFSGTADLIGSSAAVTVTVLPSDFVLSVKDTTLTIATTHHSPTTLSINTIGALSDQIDLACANLPRFATCTFAPATHDLTQTNSSTGTLTLDTDALLNYALTRPPASTFPHLPHRTAAVLALCLPLGLLATLRRRRSSAHSPHLPRLLGLLLLSLTGLTLSGCSGVYPGHVAPGTYTVTITGHARTSAIEHSTQLTLVVTP